MKNNMRLLFLLQFCLAGVVRAENIREIVIEPRGEIPVEESHARAHIYSRVGDEVTPESIARDVKALLDTRQYKHVTTVLEPLGDGEDVRVVFRLEGRYRLAEPLAIKGNSVMSRGKIREIMDLVPGSLLDEQLLDTAVQKLLEEYRIRRLFKAQVQARIIPLEGRPDSARVLLVVDEGSRTRIPLIEFSGNRELSGRRLRRLSGQSPWWNPAGWFSDKRLDSYDLELMRADARQQYADLGYLDAQISEASVSDEGNKRRISFAVHEGARYKIGRIAVEGATLFPVPQLLHTTGLKEGDIAGHTAINEGARAIRDFYAKRGYIETLVRTSRIPGTGHAGTIDLLFNVKEGELLHIRNIRIRGNTKTKDKVIRREIPLNPGDVYDEVEAERSERRLKNLGYFSMVRHYDLTLLDDTRRDLIFEVDEQPTGQLMLGAGFSSVDKVIGYLELSQSNFDLFNWGRFTGGGQKVRLGLSGSSKHTDAEVSFVEPWLFDQRLQLNLDAFARTRSHSEYDDRKLGGSVGLSRHVPWVGRVGLTYTLQAVRLSDVIEGEYRYLKDPERTYRYTDEPDSYLQGSLRLSWIYDTRNHPVTPSSGTRATVSGTLYGEALGGDNNLYEVSMRLRHYVPTFYGHVISLHIRSDVIDSLGDDDVPIDNRYFLGGGRNIRGFMYRAVGPKVTAADPATDPKTYRPIGGQTLLQASLEYTVPVTSFFRLAAFYDIGNVWDDAFDWSTEYASSYGVGMRLDIPGFPIRLDYAIPLHKDDDLSRTRRWVFWVGFD